MAAANVINTSDNPKNKAGESRFTESANNALVRSGVMIGIFILVATVLTFLVSKMFDVEMSLLFGDLDLAESSKIVTKVESMGIKTEVKAGGTQVFVPADQVSRVRMALAEQGMPSGGSVGYEIFDRGESLGTTSFVQKINRIRALEGELSRTIGSLNQISSARVHLVLPKRELFAREQQEPRASVIIKYSGTAKLKRRQVHAIQQLIASAVSGMRTANVAVVDGKGNLLARGDGQERGMNPLDTDDVKFEYEDRLARNVEMMIGRVVGNEKVRAEIVIDMDMDKITENSEIYNPEKLGHVPISVQTVEEGSDSNEKNSVGGATVTDNIPGAGTNGNSGNTNNTSRTEETTNYNMGKTLRSHIHESGGIKKISAAILVDGDYIKQADGSLKYTPRTQDQLTNLEKLVKSSIGFDEARGDKVEIVNLQFAEIEVIEGTMDDGKIMGLERHQFVKIIEMLIICFFGFLMMQFVAKPTFNVLIDRNKEQHYISQGLNADGTPIIIHGHDGNAMQQANLEDGEETEGEEGEGEDDENKEEERELSPIESLVQSKKIEGDIRSSTIDTINKVIDEYPEQTIAQIRYWINEDKGK